jgi:hypothetical protein
VVHVSVQASRAAPGSSPNQACLFLITRWIDHLTSDPSPLPLFGQDPIPTFHQLVRENFRGGLKPPFNTSARCTPARWLIVSSFVFRSHQQSIPRTRAQGEGGHDGGVVCAARAWAQAHSRPPGGGSGRPRPGLSLKPHAADDRSLWRNSRRPMCSRNNKRKIYNLLFVLLLFSCTLRHPATTGTGLTYVLACYAKRAKKTYHHRSKRAKGRTDFCGALLPLQSASVDLRATHIYNLFIHVFVCAGSSSHPFYF